MAKSQRNAHYSASQLEEEDDYTEMEDFDSDDSEEDPSYIDNLDKTHFDFANLSLKSSVRYHEPIELDDDDDDEEVEELSAPKLGIKDMKDFEDLQRFIDCGQVEKLKVDQCKVYLRKHGLRLTGKKDILIQRIKEHLEIVNGGGEKKFPPSSFVLNCKGDACMGDVVMFEQTVYEGYNIASRSAIGPPCGKRTVVGRVVKESYGAAKQQHTFTVEVLWSKGDKPLPPLHPLLIKGRNLYKLNTLRQRWEDEAERHRVLSEKHSRGSVARSNREARIQEKTLRKTLKNTSTRALPNGQHSRQEKNHKLANDHISFNSKNQGSEAQKQHTVAKNYQQQQTNQDQNRKAAVEFKENSCGGIAIRQPSQQGKTSVPASRVCLAKKDHNSSISHIDRSTSLLHSKLVESRVGSHCRLPINPHLFQVPTTSAPHFQNQKPLLYLPEHGNLISWISAFSDTSHLRSINRQHNSYGRNNQKESQKLCRYYPQGKCHYGIHCKFLHVPNRNQC